jgi:threonine/homoserine/homoserine lactone efflux protein
MLLGLSTDGACALLSGALGSLLRGNARFLRFRRYASGGTYLALGVATAVGDPPKSD